MIREIGIISPIQVVVFPTLSKKDVSNVLEHVDKDPGKCPGGSCSELSGEIGDDCRFYHL